MKTNNKVLFMTQAAMIAAIYVVLCLVFEPISYGAIQTRVAEALTVLPFFTPAAIPGLAVGCFLSNLASPLGIVDWVFGTAATLLAAFGTQAAGKLRIKGVSVLAPLPPVLANAMLVGLEVACLSEAGVFSFSHFSWAAFGAGALSVGLGELVVCYALGLPLILALEKTGASQKIFA